MSELCETLVNRLNAAVTDKAMEVIGYYGDHSQEVIEAVMNVELRRVLVAHLSDA